MCGFIGLFDADFNGIDAVFGQVGAVSDIPDLIEPFGSHDRVFERAVDMAFAPLCSDGVQQ